MDEFLEDMIDPVYRFLLRVTRDRELAADLTQEAMLRAWNKRRSLSNTSARRTWLFRIAANLYRDHWRKQRRNQGKPLDTLGKQHAPPDQVVSDREFEEHVQSALDELPDRQREVMHLRVVEQLAPSEIAEVLGIDAGLVRSNLSAARKTLRLRLRCWAPESATIDDESNDT